MAIKVIAQLREVKLGKNPGKKFVMRPDLYVPIAEDGNVLKRVTSGDSGDIEEDGGEHQSSENTENGLGTENGSGTENGGGSSSGGSGIVPGPSGNDQPSGN